MFNFKNMKPVIKLSQDEKIRIINPGDPSEFIRALHSTSPDTVVEMTTNQLLQILSDA